MDEMRKSDAELHEKFLKLGCVHQPKNHYVGVGGAGYWETTCSKCGRYEPPTIEPKKYSTTWDGYGALMEEAERRGYTDIHFEYFDDGVVVSMLHSQTNRMVSGSVGKDKRNAFALACLEVAKRQ